MAAQQKYSLRSQSLPAVPGKITGLMSMSSPLDADQLRSLAQELNNPFLNAAALSQAGMVHTELCVVLRKLMCSLRHHQPLFHFLPTQPTAWLRGHWTVWRSLPSPLALYLKTSTAMGWITTTLAAPSPHRCPRVGCTLPTLKAGLSITTC